MLRAAQRRAVPVRGVHYATETLSREANGMAELKSRFAGARFHEETDPASGCSRMCALGALSFLRRPVKIEPRETPVTRVTQFHLSFAFRERAGILIHARRTSGTLRRIYSPPPPLYSESPSLHSFFLPLDPAPLVDVFLSLKFCSSVSSSFSHFFFSLASFCAPMLL